MRSVKFLIVFALFCARAFGVITVAQTDFAQSASGSIIFLATAGVATTTGWVAVVGCQTGLGGTAMTVPTDTALNTYTAMATADQSTAAAGHLALFQSTNITGNAANIVTCHFAASAFDGVVVLYLAGAATSSALDTQFTTTTPVTATTVTSDSFNTSGANEMVVAFSASSNGGFTFTVGSIGGSTATLNKTSAAANTGNVAGESLAFATAQTGITASIGSTSSQTGFYIVGGSFKPAGAGATSNHAKGFVF